jgi:hypothetical protein
LRSRKFVDAHTCEFCRRDPNGIAALAQQHYERAMQAQREGISLSGFTDPFALAVDYSK